MTFKIWNIEEMTGYKPITTFYQDFSIADAFGLSAVKDTYRRGKKSAEWLGFKELTEFVMVLNWKILEHHGRNAMLAALYSDLWQKAKTYAEKTLKGEERAYYYRVTD